MFLLPSDTTLQKSLHGLRDACNKHCQWTQFITTSTEMPPPFLGLRSVGMDWLKWSEKTLFDQNLNSFLESVWRCVLRAKFKSVRYFFIASSIIKVNSVHVREKGNKLSLIKFSSVGFNPGPFNSMHYTCNGILKMPIYQWSSSWGIKQITLNPQVDFTSWSVTEWQTTVERRTRFTGVDFQQNQSFQSGWKVSNQNK